MDAKFLKNMQTLLHEFRQYQLDNGEPYDFDLIGLIYWLEEKNDINI